MDKFEYGAYNSQTYEHESPFADSSYIDPVNETETRKQFSYPLLELQDFINKTLPIQQGSDKVIQLRLTSDNLIQYSLDGETWLDTASGGHIIYDEDENQLPQKTKLRFDGVSVFNSGDFTIVKGLKGEQGVSVASIVQVSESSESEGLNVWRATLTDGSTFDFVVRNGHKGEQGEKGEQGNGLIILGTYASLEDLQVAHPTGNEGDLYVVGTSDSNPCYVWDTNDNAWESIGKVRGEKGAKGDKGETGTQGTGVQSITTQESSVSGGTNVVTITLTNGAVNAFNVKNGKDGERGEGLPAGGTIKQVLTKKTSTDYDCVWATIDKDSIGLGNVDNTSDADKPISTATQTALDNKEDKDSTILRQSDVINDLTSNETTKPLSAYSGNVLRMQLGTIDQTLAGKQDYLVSGFNLATINSHSLLERSEAGLAVDIRDVGERRTRNNITSYLSNLTTAIAEQNLEKYGYAVGDYFVGASGYYYYLADMDTYYGGYSSYAVVGTHHCGIVVDSKSTCQWLSSGSATSYSASTLHSFLTNTVLPNVKTDLTTLFGGWSNHLLAPTLLDNAIGTWGGSTWMPNCYIAAMSEVQMYGANVWSVDAYQTGTSAKQLDLFRKFRWNEIYGNISVWLRSLSSSSVACSGDAYGFANRDSLTLSLRASGLILFY